MKTKQSGFVPLLVMAVLAIVVVGVGYVAITVSNEAKRSLREDSLASSSNAASDYFNSGASTVAPAAKQNTPAPSQQKTSTSTPTKSISGNGNVTVQPKLSPTVTVPKTSIDSIRTFFAAVKSGDFVTANSLMGPRLAAGIAKMSGATDPSQALNQCQQNAKCSLVLNSFQPPAEGNYRVKKYTAPSGNQGEQISFLLSKSSPTVASVIGDYNIDIFSEQYAGGVWVIQDVYVNGKPLSNFF